MAIDFNKGLKRVFRTVARNTGKRAMGFYLDSYSKEGTTKKTFQSWAKRKDKKNKKPILVDTRAMKKSFKLTSNSNSFKIVNTVDYAIYHQNGIGNLPKREILYESDVLNKEIEDELEKEVIDLMNKMFK